MGFLNFKNFEREWPRFFVLSVKHFHSGVDGATFVSIKNFTVANTNGSHYFTFDISRTFRYFKVVSKSAWDGQAFAAIAEVGMF